ncbi:hypothetical protein [Asaia platycodi]|uniref:hypothetical protein n=1 Tax=Asaia platycodi TaxID=610243 RepID=UPI000471D49C|nr:hypothetical protein [Asaia platycodi]
MMLMKHDGADPQSGESGFHHHALQPLREAFPDICFSLLQIGEGRPSHADPNRRGYPDLSAGKSMTGRKAHPRKA